MAGKHGKTAKFSAIYMYYVNTYLVLHCAMKTSYFTFFGYGLFQLCSIYFSMNHHNYARWMIVYALELLILKSKNPYIDEILRHGNPFGNVGVDMALEQTINAETKNWLNGIMA